MYSPKNHKLHKFATTNSNFSKSTLSDMHHRKTYMNIIFQQNQVSRLFKTMHTNLLAKICKLQKFANCINLQLAIRISKNHAFWICTIPPHGYLGRF